SRATVPSRRSSSTPSSSPRPVARSSRAARGSSSRARSSRPSSRSRPEPRDMVPRTALLAPLALALACGANETLSPHDAPPAFPHAAFYATLQGDAEHFSFVDGDWLEDQGDAPFYGLGFYAHAGIERGNDAWKARAEAARRRALSLVTDADLIGGDLNE